MVPRKGHGMRYASAVIGCLLLLLVPSATGVASAQQVVKAETFTARVVELTNAERAKAGLGPLRVSGQLTRSAQGYAEVLATGACFGHTCAPVPEMAERSERAGYLNWQALAENIAGGQRTPERVVADWMASPGHRQNILNGRYTELGVGVASGSGTYGIYWAQEFGTRQGGASAYQTPASDASDDGSEELGLAGVEDDA